MFRSATTKLTLWYLLLATCLSLIFSVVVYHLSTEELSEALSNQYSSYVANKHDTGTITPPEAAVQRHGQQLMIELIWFNLIVVLGVSIIGYLLAGRTLKPIREVHQVQMRFTAEASHELRTPLAAMRADTEVALMDKALPVKAKQVLQGNMKDIERLERLTRHLLDIARYQNKSAIKPVVLDLDEIVLAAMKQLDQAARAKHIQYKQNIQPTQTMGEQYGLEQLVTIVLDNAIKYSHHNGVVTVDLQADVDLAILTITDNGIGISKDDVTHVFEHFYRSAAVKNNTKTASGYGLGLPLAQEIVRAHGGKIRIDSDEQHGTSIRITLPRVNQE